MKKLSACGVALLLVGCRLAQEPRTLIVMQPHEGDYLWISPESPRTLGSGGELQIYVDPETHPEAKASFSKFTLGVGGNLPVHRHAKTEEFTYFLSGKGAVVAIDEGGAEKEVPVGPGYVWYNPPGVWHTVKNTGSTPLSMVFSTVPNEKHGLLSHFRRTCAAPGKEGVALSPKELKRLAAKHDLILRPGNAPEH